ncbi:MAG: hypothetical protein R3F65_27835 [bacterium]|nr:hypothetical protein [Myxococcales bacterium]
MKRLLIVLGLVVGLPLLAVGGLIVFLLVNEWVPGELEPVTFEPPGPENAAGEPLVAGRPFTLVSWNTQFAGGVNEAFFYGGGTRVQVPRDEVEANVRGQAAVIAGIAPDLLLLQELDRASDRTHHIDQLPAFATAGRFVSVVSTPYHRARFVPKPWLDPMGAVDMHLAVLSKAPMKDAERIALAMMDEPRFVQAANLKRAVLTVSIPVEGHPQPLAVAVTHLSAFSMGDGTLDKQVDRLVQWIEARPEGQPWILAGDFNLLPPGEDKGRLSAEAAAHYVDAVNPIEKMLPKYKEVISDQLAVESRTYVPFGEKVADRKIDYVFYGGPIEVLEAKVLAEHYPWSDHLPIMARFRIGAAPVEPAVDPSAPVEPAPPVDEPPAP